jgi:phage-related minor tail protein
MANTPSGTDIVNLGVGVDTKPLADGEKALDKFGSAVVTTAKHLDGLDKALKSNADWVKQSQQNYENQIQALTRVWKEEQAAKQAIEDTNKALESGTQAQSAFIAKLNELNKTFGMGREELLRYQAELAGVAKQAEPLIANLSRLKAAQENVTAAQKAYQENLARITKEREAETAAIARQAEAEDKLRQAAIALNAQRIRDQADNRKTAAKEIEAMEKARLDQLAKEEASRTALNAQRIRAMADNRKEANRILDQMAADAAKAAEKQAIDEIAWSKKSVKARIDELEKLKQYQANSAISPSTVSSTFSNAAIKDLPNLAKYQKEYAEAVATTDRAHKAGHGSAKNFAEAIDQINFSSSRARSEIIVLAHEAVQGRFSRIPASMMVLAEYTNMASLAFSGIGVAILAAVGSIALFTYAIAKGQHEQKQFADALIMTGDYAGQTTSSMRSLAEQITHTGVTIGTAKDIVLKLAEGGRITADQMDMVSKSIASVSHATGANVDKMVASFDSLAIQSGGRLNKFSDQISNNLLKLNDQYHFLTVEVYKHIRSLELHGDQIGASNEAMRVWSKALDDRSKEAEKNLGYIEKAWDGIKKAISGAMDALMGYGRAQTQAEKIVSIQTQIKAIQSKDYDAIKVFGGKADDKQKQADQAKLVKLQEQLNYEIDVEGANRKKAIQTSREQQKTEEELYKIKQATHTASKVDKDPTSEKITAYDQLISSIKAVREELKLESATGENATRVQRMQIKLDQDLASGKLTLNEAQKALAYSDLDVARAIEKKIQLAKDDAKLIEERVKQATALGTANTKAIESAEKEAATNELKLSQLREGKSVTEEMTIARMEEQLAQMNSIGLCTAETEKLEALIAAKKKNAAALAGIEAFNVGDKAKKDLDKFLDPTKARKFGDALRGAFKGAMGALVDLSNAMGAFMDRQDELAAQYKNNDVARATGNKDQVKFLEDRDKLDRMSLQNNLAGYGAMANAAKGFFQENSTGYRMMDGIAKTFHAAQLAMNLIEMGQLAVKAVLTQAQGDPYSAFFRMAAMAAAVAALGFAVGGGFNSGSQGMGKARMEARQKAQGTGTVMGDSEAKSESLLKALEQVEKDTKEGLGQNTDMLDALRDINRSISSLAVVLVRNAGITTGQNMGIFEGQINKGGGLIGALRNLWGKTTQSITDAGLYVNAKLGDLANGQGVSQYADVQRTSSSWFGLVKKTSVSTQYGAVDPAVSKAIGDVIDNMITSLADASASFHFDPKEVDRWFREWTTVGFMSLKDMDGKEVEETLQAWFSRIGDSLAKGLMGNQLDEFQRMGEGYYETFMRVASGIQSAEFALETLGVKALPLLYVDDKQGDVGAEIVKATLKWREFGTSLFDVMDKMSGTIDEIVDSYQGLVDARMKMDAAGLGREVTFGALRGAGSIDGLNSALSTYMENMFTEAEQKVQKAQILGEQFARLGMDLPTSMEGFKELVDALMHSGEKGQMIGVQVMMLSDAFAELYKVTEDGSKAAEEAADRVAKARADLEDSYDKEATRLGELRDAFGAFGDSLTQLRDDLTMGDLSPLNTADKYTVAKMEMMRVSALAQSGDRDAMQDYQAKATQFLELSKQFNASGQGYNTDYNQVMTDIARQKDMAANQETTAEQSLSYLKSTVDHLLGVEENTKTIAEAISNYSFLKMTGGVLPGDSGVAHLDGVHASGLSYVPFDGYRAELHQGERVLTSQENSAYNTNLSSYGKGANEALVQEIRGLREEVRQLKEEQRDQTARLVVSNYDASDRNASTVVEGLDECISKAARKDAIKPTLS